MAYTTQYTVQQVCDIIGIELPEEYENIANDVLTSMALGARFIKKDGAFFLAYNVEDDHEEKIQKALQVEAKIIFLDEEYKDCESLKGLPHIVVPNVFEAVVRISTRIREEIGMKVVGVTGSLGKTSTKDILYSVLSQKYITNRSINSLNTINPLFENIQKISRDTEIFVQEFGIGAYGSTMEMARACLPDAGVITIISDPHLDVFGSKENILNEKMKMITQAPKECPAFLNYDDELLKNADVSGHPVISYAVNNRSADYYADNIEVFDGYMLFDVVHGEKRLHVRLNSLGKPNVGNVLAAVAIGEWFGLSDEQIVEGIAAYKSGGIRQNLVNIGGYKLYLDCFNTAPVSLVDAVEVLERLSVEEGGKRIAVIGDMPRLGEQEVQLHIDTGMKISTTNLDMVLCFGNENAKIMADVIGKGGIETYYASERETLNALMKKYITRKDVVLVKGSVARLLSRSVDQVFGTSYHVVSGHFQQVVKGDFNFRVIHESENVESKMTSLSKYTGNDKCVVIPAECDGAELFCLGSASFVQNRVIESVKIPAPIFNIADGAFRGCSKLKKVELPHTMKVIGERAFRNCVSMQEIVIPEGVIHLGARAFEGCKSLESVVLPESLVFIGKDAFSKCPKVKFSCKEKSYAEEYVKNL